MRKIGSAALLALLVLGACGEGNQLTEGDVVGKEYDDPDTERWWSSMCAARDARTGVCTMSIPVEHVDHDDAHWYLTIVGYDEDGKQLEEKHEVTQTLYDLAHNGLHVDLSDQSIVPR